MTEAKIIVIDDNAAILKTLGIVLKGVFTTVITVGDPQLIPAIISAGDVDVVLLDMNFGAGRLDGQDGLFWLDRIKHRSHLPHPPAVVLITAFGDVALAVESLKQGADDFVQKPWNNDRLIQILNDAINKRRADILHKDVASDGQNVVNSYILSLVKRYASTYFRPEPEVTDEAMERLITLARSGEFTRLEDTIERTVLMTQSTRWTADTLCLSGASEPAPTLTLDEMEKQFVITIWDDSEHNLTKAAKRLGLSRTTLYNKLKKYGIY